MELKNPVVPERQFPMKSTKLEKKRAMTGCRAAVLLVLLVTLGVPRPGATQIEAIAGNMGVTAVISELQSAIQQIIDQLQAEASLLSFDVRSDLLVTAENLARMSLEFEGKLFQDLNQTERKALTDIRAAVKQFQDGNNDTLEKLDSTIRTVGLELTRIPGTSKEPFVTGVRPTYVITEKESSLPVEIIVSGSSLGRAATTLAFGGNECAVIKSDELHLRFSCVAKNIAQSENNNWSKGILSISRRSSWWQFWADDINVTYPVGVRRIDKTLGPVVAHVKLARKTSRSVNRIDTDKWVRAEKCRSATEVFKFDPDSNCKIKIDSVSVGTLVRSSRSGVPSVTSIKPHGFVVKATAVGSGDSILGVCSGGRGTLKLEVKWKELCETTTNEWVKVPTPEHIKWGSDYSITLPDDNLGFKVTVSQANGEVKEFTKTDETEWLSVDYDKVANTVVLRPKTLEEAFK